MNFNEYRPFALRTAKMFPTRREDLEHALLGLSTESGEFNTAVKRVVIYNKSWDDFVKGSTTITLRMNAKEELADTGWYVPLAMLALGIDELPSIDDEDEILRQVNTLKDCGIMLAGLVGGVAICGLLNGHGGTEGVAEALAAINFVIDRAAVMLGTTGDELRAENIAKLRDRFPDSYSDAAAEARADKGGVDATLS